jgi:Na+/H+ antiporter NhaD/arsenite permease-like protein
VEDVVINPWMIVPFGLLLIAIAWAPLSFPVWWSKHYAITLVYYLFGLHLVSHVLETAHEYVSFIALVGSLFVVSGGIHINVKGEATPVVNVVFLLIGAIIANVLGNTGASMLLIGPWIRMNKYRITAHHIVFFIFVVSNVGGCLTPMGPPLFFGYFYGIPFWWFTRNCLPMWVLGVGILLVMFYFVDRANFTRAPRDVRARETAREEWRFDGLPNVLFLAVILFAVFVSSPLFLRELLMLGAAVGSYFTTRKAVHEANHFNFHPIKEVAILFIGIFATMMPALDWLAGNAGELVGRHPAPGIFYWGAGTLSSVLDNAPTYLSFLNASIGSFVNHDVVAEVQTRIASGVADFNNIVGPHAEQIRQTLDALQRYHGDHIRAHQVSREEVEVSFLLGSTVFHTYVLAISVASVFFGACTYIGNGPNFMVKSIADHRKIRMPGFLEYIWRFALPFMLPMLILIWLLFFR